MMTETDPTFETREELAAWAANLANKTPPTLKGTMDAIDQIERVAIAHAHLPEVKVTLQ